MSIYNHPLHYNISTIVHSSIIYSIILHPFLIHYHFLSISYHQFKYFTLFVIYLLELVLYFNLFIWNSLSKSPIMSQLMNHHLYPLEATQTHHLHRISLNAIRTHLLYILTHVYFI